MPTKAPCSTCPWRRDSTPGGIGTKEPVDTFIGQVYGPFVLPCHATYTTREEALHAPPCAGAAIFRSNICRTLYLPKALHQLPADPMLVFATMEEFKAHHDKISVEQASDLLAINSPLDLMREQLRKQDNVYTKI